MKLKPLTKGQRLGWFFASAIFGVIVMIVPQMLTPERFDGLDQTGKLAAFSILAFCWGIGVFFLRVYVQEIEDPTNVWSILGIKRK